MGNQHLKRILFATLIIFVIFTVCNVNVESRDGKFRAKESPNRSPHVGAGRKLTGRAFCQMVYEKCMEKKSRLPHTSKYCDEQIRRKFECFKRLPAPPPQTSARSKSNIRNRNMARVEPYQLEPI